MRHLAKLSLVPLLLLAGVAEAHPSASHVSGFVAGFSHPLGGLDHLLAMVAVGLWATQVGGRAIWLVPAAFVGTMAVAGVLAMGGSVIPFVEQGIAASVLLLGLLIATALRLPTPAAVLLVGIFAAFHGIAHGVELPEASAPLGYAAGFVIATALLHGLGIALGLAAAPRLGVRLVQAAGAAIALAGVVLAAG